VLNQGVAPMLKIEREGIAQDGTRAQATNVFEKNNVITIPQKKDKTEPFVLNAVVLLVKSEIALMMKAYTVFKKRI
jgi:hypothetical protein